MSDSELSETSISPAPPDAELDKSLRGEVTKAFKDGREYTVNSIRAASEKNLGLTAGFYKNGEWLSRSKQIITNQSDVQNQLPSSPPQSPKAATTSPAKPKKRASEDREPWPRKRKKTANEPAKDVSSEELSSPPSDADSESFDEQPKKKQQRKTPKSKPKQKQKQKPKKVAAKKAKAVDSDEATSDGGSDNIPDGADERFDERFDEKPSKQPPGRKTAQSAPKKTAKAVTKKKAQSEDSEPEREEVDNGKDDTDAAFNKNGVKKDTPKPVEDSDSELSSLIDEAPAPKKRQKQQETSGKKSKKGNPAKGKPEADLDPDQAEIKRLQGWLVKCGIRKVWGKELKPYETPKAKIKHLKEMLTDAGMTGRFSQEKANQIKESRELAADIEAVQAGAERWGADETDDRKGKADDDDDDNGGGRPARRLVRGSKNYDFLSSDGEETD